MGELRIYGDKLDIEIEGSEKDLEALQNTVAVLKEGNRRFENSYTEAEPEMIQERDSLGLKFKEIKGIVSEKRRKKARAMAKIQVMQTLRSVYSDPIRKCNRL